MIALIYFLAAAVLLLDFVFVVACPFLNLISSPTGREGFSRILRFWGTVSIGVGFLGLIPPAIMILDYIRAKPDSLLREGGFLSYLFGMTIGIVIVVVAPLVLGYILRRFSLFLQEGTPGD